MRKLLIGLLMIGLMADCGKKNDECNYDECSIRASATEITSVKNYLTSQTITATQHCSGAFYIITSEGTGTRPSVCNNVNVTYTGKLTNGTTFDSGTNTFLLGQLIAGWKATIPLIKSGGSIRLYLPPSLGYGAQAVGTIPANSILIFDITLNSVK